MGSCRGRVQMPRHPDRRGRIPLKKRRESPSQRRFCISKKFVPNWREFVPKYVPTTKLAPPCCRSPPLDRAKHRVSATLPQVQAIRSRHHPSSRHQVMPRGAPCRSRCQRGCQGVAKLASRLPNCHSRPFSEGRGWQRWLGIGNLICPR